MFWFCEKSKLRSCHEADSTGKVEEPVVEFGSFEKTGQQIYYVKDNGFGFDMGLASRLFKPFTRLHEEKEFPGIGVGLAIAAKAISSHNGDIWTESEPGSGTTFYFTLGNEELNRN